MATKIVVKFSPTMWYSILVMNFELKRYICFSCNIKRYKTTAKFSENSWNKRRSKFFKRRHLWCQRLYCYRFFLLLNRNQVPEMLYFGQWPYIAKKLSSQCNLTPQIEPVQDKTGLYCNQHIYCLYKDECINICFTRLLDI
jgi:hypothetical protein